MTNPAFGVGESGQPITWDPHIHHSLLSGGTGSGKSSTSYSMIAGAVGDRTVQIVGIDPSSLLLAPFGAKSGDGLIALGTSHLDAAIELLERIVDLMDLRSGRLAALGVDTWPVSPRNARILVVLEEYGGLLAACESQDAVGGRGADRLRARVVRAVGRLLREGRKTGILVFTIIQRPDAQVIGGADRGQYTRRIAHRLDNNEGVRMVFEGASNDTTARLSAALPGVGALGESGHELTFFRSYHVDYSTFLRHVTSRYHAMPIAGLTEPTDWTRS